MKNQVIILGETTFDIIFSGNKPVEAKTGGSQLNSAVSLGRSGIQVDFISELGTDRVAQTALLFLKENNINSRFISRYEGNSRLALAYLNDEQKADFNFYLPENTGKLKFPAPPEGGIILFGSSFARRIDIREDLVRFLNHSKQENNIILYDVNYRPSSKHNLSEIKKMTLENINLSSIVKGSDEDFRYIFGTSTAAETAKVLSKYSRLPLFYTSGPNKTEIILPDRHLTFPVKKINPVSTIGAGDAFNAGLIYSLIKMNIKHHEINALNNNQVRTMVHFASLFATRVCLSMENYVPHGYNDMLQSEKGLL